MLSICVCNSLTRSIWHIVASGNCTQGGTRLVEVHNFFLTLHDVTQRSSLLEVFLKIMNVPIHDIIICCCSHIVHVYVIFWLWLKEEIQISVIMFAWNKELLKHHGQRFLHSTLALVNFGHNLPKLNVIIVRWGGVNAKKLKVLQWLRSHYVIRPHRYTVNENYDPVICSLNQEERGRDFPTMLKCEGLSYGAAL